MKDDPSPCYFCNDHSAYCHSGCSEWDIWKANHEAKRLAKAKKWKAEGECIEYRKQLHYRLEKQARYHKGREKKGK